MAIINNITMLAIVLTGSALIREREHGTIEHLLVMPVTPFEIMLAKIWSMGLVVLVVSGLSLVLMVQGILQVPIEDRFHCLCWGWRSACSPDLDRHFMGTLARFDAAAGAADDHGLTSAADALRRIHAARKYAAAGTGYYVDHADHPLRQHGAGDIVSRRQLRHRLAAVLNLAGYRRSVLYYRVAAFS